MAAGLALCLCLIHLLPNLPTYHPRLTSKFVLGCSSGWGVSKRCATPDAINESILSKYYTCLTIPPPFFCILTYLPSIHSID
ncbi:hypothetical protein F4775DRAFT_579681 [Biscogniauxia sp. FL1348]|nr:hypothetical protein F4775DRAFT_579681 [Biscogniauxia sp. FL1348]